MSKIQQAIRKRSLGEPNFEFSLASLQKVSLFPPPPAAQQAEFAALANMIMEFRRTTGGVAICFASSTAGEGASFVSYHAAQQLAYVMNRRVAWIDANFKSPQRKLLASGMVGMADLLQDPDRIEELPTQENLVLVPGGLELSRSSMLLASEAYPQMLNRFRENFDFTLVDCPPILHSIETGLLAVAADGLIAVVERKRLKWEVIRHGLEFLASKRVNVLGTVFNRRAFELPRAIYDRI